MPRLVCFRVHGRELAVPIDQVRETVELRPITPVFRTPPAVAGVVSIRGEILAVLDTAVMLGLPPSSRDPSSRILIVEPDNRAAGLLVDALGAIRTVDENGLGPIPPTVSPSVAAVLAGVLTLPEHPVGVIDVARLFAVPELAPFVRKGQDAIEESSSP